MRLLLLSLLTSASLFAQPGNRVRLVPIATVAAPVDIQNAADGSNRLFIVEQDGRIRLYKDGALLAQPFLDISNKTNGSGECGLLGLAFPPAFGTRQYFYVSYTNPNCTQSVIARYRVSVNDPDVADPNTEQILLTQAQPFTNHNGGQIRFGPDGYLYISFGDGGSGGDPQGNAQNLNTLLGKILRIDVEPDLASYDVPPDNPFVNTPNTRPEIWAYGLRNVWRFSFDRDTGDLWMGDVGQNDEEEIDFQPAGDPGGQNYGWNIVEGNSCYPPGSSCDPSQFTAPVVSISHDNGDGCVIGGVVYRGARKASLIGAYLLADCASGRLWSFRQGEMIEELRDTRNGFSSFGEDEDGEVYLADTRRGIVFAIR